MLFGGLDHALTGLPAAFFRSTVREGEPPVVAGEKHGHERRVPVHDGLLARTVPRADHSHTVVFRVDRVMLRVNVNGISRDWLWFRSCRHFASVSLWNGVPGNGASIPLGTKGRNPNLSIPKIAFALSQLNLHGRNDSLQTLCLRSFSRCSVQFGCSPPSRGCDPM